MHYSLRSVHFANHNGGIPIRTVQAGDSRLLQNHPTDSVLRLQTEKILQLKLAPPLLRLHLSFPFVGHRREHRNSTAGFVPIRQRASLRDCFKTVFILTRNSHVPGIQGEDRINRRVGTNPIEGLHPLVFRRDSRPFNLSARGEQVALDQKHARAQRNKKRCPSPNSILQYIFAEQSTPE